MPIGSPLSRQKAAVMQWYVPDHRHAASTDYSLIVGIPVPPPPPGHTHTHTHTHRRLHGKDGVKLQTFNGAEGRNACPTVSDNSCSVAFPSSKCICNNAAVPWAGPSRTRTNMWHQVDRLNTWSMGPDDECHRRPPLPHMARGSSIAPPCPPAWSARCFDESTQHISFDNVDGVVAVAPIIVPRDIMHGAQRMGWARGGLTLT